MQPKGAVGVGITMTHCGKVQLPFQFLTSYSENRLRKFTHDLDNWKKGCAHHSFLICSTWPPVYLYLAVLACRL